MATLAYPYPNLFPHIESKCLWSYSVDGEEHKEFKEPLSNWDYKASLEIKCKLTWNIRDIFEQANLLTIINYSRIAIFPKFPLIFRNIWYPIIDIYVKYTYGCEAKKY